MRIRSSFRALAAALVASFVFVLADHASADPPSEPEAVPAAPVLLVTPAQLRSPRLPVSVLDARLTEAERVHVHLLERRLRGARLGATFGGLLVGASGYLALLAATVANPWCLDLNFSGDPTYDGCTPPPVDTGAVVGLSTGAALAGIVGLGLVFGDGARARGIRAELRAIRDPSVRLRMPDAEASAYRVVFRARF